MNPYTKDDPGELIIKNKLSLLEEIEKLSDNYTHSINDIIGDINNSLDKSKIPRTFGHLAHCTKEDLTIKTNIKLPLKS